jgi:GxxExxY protein
LAKYSNVDENNRAEKCQAEKWGHQMPISVDAKLMRLSQTEFGKIAYRVMHEVFAVHAKLGRLFDEQVYQHALATQVADLKREVKIDVCFRDFRKQYFMDAVVANGAVFELKAVDSLTSAHRSQLLNYLLLCELKHGKLVNLRPEKIAHEFVNTRLTLAERRQFRLDDNEWHPTKGFGTSERTLLVELLNDWGTGLERALYEEALIHLLGGKEQVITQVDISLGHGKSTKQAVALCGPRTMIRVTAFEKSDQGFAEQLKRFLDATGLDVIQWINISRHRLTLKTLDLSA